MKPYAVVPNALKVPTDSTFSPDYPNDAEWPWHNLVFTVSGFNAYDDFSLTLLRANPSCFVSYTSCNARKVKHENP